MNSIEFTLDRYNNNGEQMYQDVAKQLQLLHYNGYDCRVWSDCGEVIVIEFDFKSKAFAERTLCWLTEDEIDAVNEYNDNLKDGFYCDVEAIENTAGVECGAESE